MNNTGKCFRRQGIPAWVVSASQPRIVPAVSLAANINSVLLATSANLSDLKAQMMCFLPQHNRSKDLFQPQVQCFTFTSSLSHSSPGCNAESAALSTKNSYRKLQKAKKIYGVPLLKRYAINCLSSLLVQCFMPDVSILAYFGAYSPNIIKPASMERSCRHKGRKMCKG